MKREHEKDENKILNFMADIKINKYKYIDGSDGDAGE